jgi:tetratricopeptide (TPR) repeat protein
MVSVVLFFCTARYRAPILPPLILLAVYAVFEGVRAVNHKRWKAIGIGSVVLALAAALVYVAPEGKQYRNDAFAYLRLGTAYARKDRLDQAGQCYRKAVEIAPFFLTAHFKLGTLLRHAGQLDEAIAEFRAALATPKSMRLTGETDVRVAQVHYNLGQALEERGDRREAQEHYRTALRLDPDCCPGLVEVERAGESRQVERAQSKE